MKEKTKTQLCSMLSSSLLALVLAHGHYVWGGRDLTASEVASAMLVGVGVVWIIELMLAKWRRRNGDREGGSASAERVA